MPFGLNTAPETFTDIMRACIKQIRQRWRVTALHYLDDLLFLHPDPEYLKQATIEILHFLTWLGWVVNMQKTEPEPKQKFVFLGWLWDSVSMSIFLPPDKRRAKLDHLRWFRRQVQQQATISVRQLAKTIGILSSTRLQHRQASLFLHCLDEMKTTAAKAVGWNGRLKLEQTKVQQELEWWQQALTANTPRPITSTPPQATIHTDACPLGWGGTVKLLRLGETVMMHGRWGRMTATSNSLECRAVERTLRRLKQLPAGRDIQSVIIRSDNTTTCYNINRRNATASLLPPLASLLRFAERAQIEMVAEHVPGVQNETASPGGDYSLNLSVLQQLLMEWRLQIDVDLFAEYWNAKHPCFWS
jgi:ribonuclease HI